MADNRKIFELAFSIGGKLNPAFSAATSEALKSFDKLKKKGEELEIAKKQALLNKEFSKSFEELGKSASGAGAAWANLGKSIMKPISDIGKLAAVGVAGGVAVYGLAAKTAEMGDVALKTSQKLNMSAKAFQSLSYAAEQSNITNEAFSSSLKKLNQTYKLAIEGNKNAQMTFRRAGVAIHDVNGRLKSTDEILLEVSKMFKQMSDNGVEDIHKISLATALLGKNGADLVPMLSEGSYAIRELQKDAERLGRVRTDEELFEANRLSDNITEAQNSIAGLAFEIGSKLHPILADITKSFSDFVALNRELIGAKAEQAVIKFKEFLPETGALLAKIRDGIVYVVDSVSKFVEKNGGLEKSIKKITVAWAAVRISGIIGSLANATGNTAKLIRQVWLSAPAFKIMGKLMLSTSKGAIVSFIGGMKKMALGFISAIPKIWAFNAALLANPLVWIPAAIVAAIAAIVLLEKHFKLFSNLFTDSFAFIKKDIDNIKEAFSQGFGKGILTVIAKVATLGPRMAFNTVRSMIKSFTGFDIVPLLQEKFEAIKTMIFDKIEIIKLMFSDGFLNGIKGILQEFNPIIILNDAINAIFGIDMLAIGKSWIKGFIDGVINSLKNAAGTVKQAVSGLLPQELKNIAGGAINIVKGVIPKFFAEGGIVNRPTLSVVGEAGAEAIIPLTKPNRAAQIIRDIAPMYSKIGQTAAVSPVEQLSTVNNNNSRTNNVGGTTFNFSPNITIQGGNGSPADIQTAVNSALNQVKSQFENWYLNMQRQNLRVAIA